MPAPLTDALLEWADAGWRELPWRRTRDPWAVLVSELMLQETQVARVIPKWTAFLERWPTPAACAASPRAEVVKAWAGLGYNSRALRLHACAAAVVARHGGTVPDDVDALLALPGVGPYTARAVLAFAYDRDVGVLDTNAARVVARAAAGRPLGRRDAQAIADALVPVGRAWAWNQAVLDLGAQVCTARRPACAACPVAHACAWHRMPGAPDPAARTSRQSRFEGSARQGRGRLLDALRSGPVTDLAVACGWPADRARARIVANQLVTEGFAEWSGRALRLKR